MDKIKALESKYRFACEVWETPYKYIQGTIKELSTDIEEIDKISAKNTDTEVLQICASLKSKLNTLLKSYKVKLENIPNQHYLEESDEEWVDVNRPN